MRSLTIRLPETLAARLEAEARERKLSKSDIVRERLEAPYGQVSGSSAFAAIVDLVGSLDDTQPADLSARKKHYLKATGYGRKRSR